MPGALVGEAYVLMRSDGTLLKSDMTKAAQSAARAAGKDSAKAFRKSWNDEFGKSQKQLDEGLALSFARMAGQRDFRRYIRQFKSIEEATKNLNKELDLLTKPQNGKEALLTKTMEKQIRAGFNESVKILREQQAEIDATADAERKRLRQLEIDTNIEKQIRAEEKQGIREVVKEVEDRAKAEDDQFKRRIRQLTTLDSRIVKYQKQRVKEEEEFFKRRIKNLTTLDSRVKLYYQRRNALHAEALRENERRDREAAAAERARLIQRVRYLTYYDKRVKGLVTYDIPDPVLKRIKRQGTKLVREGNTILVDWDKKVTRPLGNRVGRLFGQGARNDFVNAIGRGVNFLVRQLTTVVGLGAKFGGAVTAIGKGFFDFGKILGSGGGFKNALAALGGGFGNALKILGGPQGLIAAVATLVGSIFLFGKIIPGIVSTITGLVGGLGAMAAVMLNGVAAAAVTAIPLLAGLTANIGALGFAAYKWAQQDKVKDQLSAWNKELTKTVEYLFPELNALFRLTRRGVNAVLTPVIKNLDESLENLITNLGGTVDGIAAKNGPTIKALSEWKKTIVEVSKNFGDAFSDFTIGLINFFRPILPYAERFSQYIADAAEGFSKWTQGTEGQGDIKEWIDGAVVALKDTWSLLGEIGGLIGDVFFSTPGQDAGKSLIRSLRDWVRDIRDYIAENPDALAKWFKDAREITEAVGGIAVSVGNIVVALNSEEGRRSAKELMEGIQGIADAGVALAGMTDTLATWADYISIIITGLASIAGGKSPVLALAEISKKFADIQAREARKAEKEAAEAARKIREAALKEIEKTHPKPIKIKALIDADTKDWEKYRRALNDFTFKRKTIPVEGNVSLWNKVKGTVAAQIFDPKSVAVTADARQWNSQKRVIEQYGFDPKKIDVYGPTASELAAIRDKIRASIPDTISTRVNVGFGDISGGVPREASGTILYGPRTIVAGEAGPEAIVPLARNLSQVDSSVRQLSAIAQGKAIPMASGGIVGGGGGQTVTVEEGAVQVVTQATSPNVVGSIVLDGIADALASAV